MADVIDIGIIGVGNMGQAHARLIERIPTLNLTACADIDPARKNKVVERYGCKGFDDGAALLRAKACEAVIISTPHYDHTTLGISALTKGYHVLVEKPISVHKADCEKLIRAHRNPSVKFAAMFNQRTNTQYQAIKQLIDGGELGQIRRIQWTITDWFRSQSYYDSGGWRATWAGEGGGVLMNQCPHQLDLMQWLFGMPSRLQAFCDIARDHDIEVEDHVTCYLEYESGASGVFTTTTGEAPGINRLEIAAENGLVVHDAGDATLTWVRNDKTVTRALAENAGFEKPGTELITLDIPDTGRQHAEVLENFAEAILHDAPLIARAEEGIHSVELANAMLLSSARRKPIDLPISSRSYTRFLKKQIRDSTFRKKEATGEVADDMSSSF